MIRTVRRWSAKSNFARGELDPTTDMLIWGEEDTHIPISEALRLRDAIPNSRLIVFRRCGHLPPTEYPEKFVEVVADFCKNLRSVPGAVATGSQRPTARQ